MTGSGMRKFSDERKQEVMRLVKTCGRTIGEAAFVSTRAKSLRHRNNSEIGIP